MASVNFILQLPMTVYKYKWFCVCVLFQAGIPRNQTLRWLCETFIKGHSKEPRPKEKMEADLGRGRSWMQTQPIPSWALQVGRLLRACPELGEEGQASLSSCINKSLDTGCIQEGAWRWMRWLSNEGHSQRYLPAEGS